MYVGMLQIILKIINTIVLIIIVERVEMTFIKQSGDGEHYIYRKRNHSTRYNIGKAIKDVREISNIFLVKDNSGCGSITLSSLIFPKEFIGKKVMFKMIVLDD